MARRRYPVGTYMQVVAGKAIKRRRKALKYSLRDVAELMNRPNSYTFIGRLEREEHHTCTPEFAASLAAVLGRDVDELFMPRLPKSDGQAAQERPFRRGRAA